MSQGDVYYNEEYAPISDDYIAAEVRAAQLNQKKPSRKYKKVKRQRPKSRYDEDMYALPEMEEDGSIKQDNQKEPVTNPKYCQTKKRRHHCLRSNINIDNNWRRNYFFQKFARSVLLEFSNEI